MKTASLREIKKELETLHPSQLIQLCIRLIKYKKENKELAGYLLFDSDDEKGFIKQIKEETDGYFDDIRKSNVYMGKKQIRKCLRLLNKYIKYSGNKQTEVELRIYFCSKLRHLPGSFLKQTTIAALYMKQVAVIRKALSSLHEDLQFDYEEELRKVTEY